MPEEEEETQSFIADTISAILYIYIYLDLRCDHNLDL